MTDDKTFWSEGFAQTDVEAIQAVANLAKVQLVAEEICGHPELGQAVHRPEDAAGPDELRSILDAAAEFNVSPQPDTFDEYAKIMADGAYIRQRVTNPRPN